MEPCINMSNNREPWFSLRDLRYYRQGEHAIDNVHLLFPLGTGEFDYALPTDSSNTVLRLVHYLFSSLDENEEFDNDNFQALLQNLNDPDGLTMQTLVKDEFLATDFLVFSSFKAHKSIDESIGGLPEINLGLRASMLILQRVLSSFQSISILIKNSMYFDVNCLLRSVLEQIGHAYQIRGAKDKIELDRFEPTKSITPLKEIIPDAGSLNGMLSDYIHNNKKIWGVYVESEPAQEKSGNKTYVVARSGRRTKDCILVFTRIIEAYFSVLADIYLNHCQQIESDFRDVAADCFDHIAKLKRDMAGRYYSEPEASA